MSQSLAAEYPFNITTMLRQTSNLLHTLEAGTLMQTKKFQLKKKPQKQHKNPTVMITC